MVASTCLNDDPFWVRCRNLNIHEGAILGLSSLLNEVRFFRAVARCATPS